MQREPGESGGCGVSAADIRWTQSAQDFYPSSSRMIDRLRELTVNAMIYASLAKDEVLRRVGLLGEGGPCVHFIYLHHVFGDESAPFRELLGRLSRKVQFLSHSDAVSKVQQGSIDRVYASLSFDDGLVSCLEGARILEEFGARGCFFVCPAVVDRCRDPQWIARWCRERLQKTPAKVMGWGDLEALQARGHEIGNHTLNHSNLAAATGSTRSEEIGEAREQLVRKLGDSAGRHFAWPYGEARHIDAEAVRDIMDAGHSSCSSAVRGVHVPGPARERCPVILRNHAVFLRPVYATEFFMRRNIRNSLTEFRHQ